MLSTAFYHFFAQAYGQGAYNTCTYDCATGASSSSSSGLANTGVAVGLFVGVACLIIFIALVVRFWRRGKKAKTGKKPEDS